MPIHECPHCICGRRAPVQRSDFMLDANGQRTETRLKVGDPGFVAGSITWEEHEKAWADYDRRYPGQSAQRTAERGGFSYSELVIYLGRRPETWSPMGNEEARAAVCKLAREQQAAGTYTDR